MPSDSNGVYSLPDGYLAVTGTTIQASQHNPPLEDIASSMTERVMRTGAAPMTGPLKHSTGSAAAPSVTFNSGTGTGIYLTSDGVGVSVDGTEVAEFTSAGLSTGVRFIGELFAYVGSTAPSLCVFPIGQTLSRTTYADLWALAQVEIAAGNMFFNNGNGTTTFGIGDLRGRVIAAKDGTGQLTTAGCGIDGATLGATGGVQNIALTASQIPSISSLALISITVHARKNGTVSNVGGTTVAIDNLEATSGGGIQDITYTQNPAITSSNTGGQSHFNAQPTIITNIAMFAGA